MKGLNDLSLNSIEVVKTQNAFDTEYGIAVSPIARWVKQYSEVKIDNGTNLADYQI